MNRYGYPVIDILLVYITLAYDIGIPRFWAGSYGGG